MPVRVWQMSGVKYVIMPAQGMGAPEVRIPGQNGFVDTNAPLVPEFGFNVAPGVDNDGVTVSAGQFGQSQHYVCKVEGSLPRYSFKGDWIVVDDKKVFDVMGNPVHFDPLKTVCVPPEFEKSLPSDTPTHAIGTVTKLSESPRKVTLQVTSDGPGLLLVVRKYSPDWIVTVDGKPADLIRCNYLVQGVPVEAGTHDVLLVYAPPNSLLWAQAVGILLCGAALGMLLYKKKHGKGDAE